MIKHLAHQIRLLTSTLLLCIALSGSCLPTAASKLLDSNASGKMMGTLAEKSFRMNSEKSIPAKGSPGQIHDMNFWLSKAIHEDRVGNIKLGLECFIRASEQAPSPSFHQNFRLVRSLAERDHFNAAENFLEKVKKSGSSKSELDILRGVIFLERGDESTAVCALKRACAAGRFLEAIYYTDAAEMLIIAGAHAEALEVLEEVLSKFPRDFTASYLKVACLVELKHLKNAQVCCRQLYKGTRDLSALIVLLDIDRQLKNWNDLIADSSKVSIGLDQAAIFERIHEARGDAFAALKRFGEARKEYSLVLEERENELILRKRAYCLRQLGHDIEASFDLKRAMILSSQLRPLPQTKRI